MSEIPNTPSSPATPVPPPAPQASTTSTMTVISLILGILSLTCCGFVAGIPAFFIGRSEMAAATEGRIHANNHTMAKIGMILGIVGTVLSCLGTLAYVGIIALSVATGSLQH